MKTDFKIAICFSGQLREWESAYPSIQRFMNFFDNKPDTFCHVWDFNTTSHAVKSHTGEDVIELVGGDELDKFIEIYAPTRYLIEDKAMSDAIEFRSYEYIKLVHGLQEGEDIATSPYWLAPQYYGISRASILKQEYELENNFTYDLVIRMRYDSYFTDAFFEMLEREDINYIDPFTIYTTHSSMWEKYPYLIIGDVFFMSDSLTFNILGDYVNHLPHVFQCFSTKDTKPEELFAFYVKSNFLKIKPMLGDVKVKRPPSYFQKLEQAGIVPYPCDSITE